MNVTPLTLRAARAYVDEHHRHHRAPQGGLFAVGAEVLVAYGKNNAEALRTSGIDGQFIPLRAAEFDAWCCR